MRHFALIAHAAVVFGPAGALAQAYNYPAFQTPRTVEREYNFAAATASRAGTSLLFQWREALAPSSQFGLDVGLAAPRDADTRLLIGLAWAREVAHAGDQMPFDIGITAGAGASVGGGSSVLRVPLGAVAGHSFDLEDGFRLTPFAHPRVVFDRCSTCRAGRSDSKLDVDVDLGLDFAVTSAFSLRVAALLGGTDYNGDNNAVGFSVAWRPQGPR